MFKKVFGLFGLISICLIIMSFTVYAVDRDVLTYGRGSDSLRLDPQAASDGESIKVCYLIYEGLVRFKPGTTSVEPCLATRWRTSSDGLTWIFNLRKGVKFHDGTPFNADAVVFTFKRLIDKDNPYKFKKMVYWAMSNVKEVKKIDNYTVSLVSDKPYAPLLSNLATYATFIISPTAMKKHGVEDYSKSPVGTGPFKFDGWVPDERIVLAANNKYWSRTPRLKKIIFKVIKENSTRLRQLEGGIIDIMDGLDPQSMAKIIRNSSLRLVSRASLSTGYVYMNTQMKPFDDKRVRQAVNYAFNKEPLVKIIYQGRAQPAKNPIPPTVWSYNDAIKPYEFNPKKAKKLLAEAGYPDGIDVTFEAMDNPRPYMPDGAQFAQLFKDNLEASGIRLNVIVNPWKKHIEKIYSGETQMGVIGWSGDNGDPDNFLYLLLDVDNTEKGNAQNHAMYDNPKLHEILIKAQQSSNLKERTKLYEKAQEIIHVDAPWVPIAHPDFSMATSSKVKNFQSHPIVSNIVSLVNTYIEE